MSLAAALQALIAEHDLPAAYAQGVETVLTPLAERIARLHRRVGRSVVTGVCGAQGTGKSTLCAFLAELLEHQRLRVAVLSLDDLYLTREARAQLAARVHPLFATRGVPGTHEVELGEHVLDALARPGLVRLPRFDKAADTRAPPDRWAQVQAPVDVVLFEGWCLGARPQPASALNTPVNALEREEDSDGVWRRAVNEALTGPYAHLFARLDALVLIAAPAFEQVFAWRALQERRLATAQGDAPSMSDDALVRFIRHYERLTRHILAEMPARADAVIAVDEDHAMAPACYRAGGMLDI